LLFLNPFRQQISSLQPEIILIFNMSKKNNNNVFLLESIFIGVLDYKLIPGSKRRRTYFFMRCFLGKDRIFTKYDL